MTGRLDGRAVAVVGAATSIGRASASRFAAEGAHVLAVDPDTTAVASVCGEIVERGGTATALVCELDGEGPAVLVAARCDELWGRLDGLFVCSAAIDAWAVADDTVERWGSVLRTNLLGPAAFTTALLPLLARSVAGAVVYLSSIDGILGNPNVPAYSISKGGLLPLTHVMADRGGEHGVRVNCIASGGIRQVADTSPAVERQTHDAELQRRLTPLGRKATADDIASVALFFLSDDSAYVTGTVLPVDGGRLAVTPGTGRALLS